MSTFFNAFVSGELSPLLTHAILLGGAIAAEFAVAAGIILESPKNKTFREWLGLGLVFGGVLISSIFTISLFVFDEGVSDTQRSELKVAELQLADAVKTAANAQKDAALANERAAEIMKATAWRRIEPEAAQKLSEALAAIPAAVPHKIVFAYVQSDPEALYLAYQIGRVFLAEKNWDANIFAESHAGILYWGIRVLGPDNETTQGVRKAFEAAGIEFSTDAVPGAFQSYGYMPKPDDTLISVGPKKPPFEP